MKLQEIHGILQDLRFRDWTFCAGSLPGGHLYLQVQFHAPDNDDPAAPPSLQQGRKWLVDREATESQVVRTAWAAVMMAMEHELREQFTYRGRAIFSPHFDVRALLGLPIEEAADPAPPAPLVEVKPEPLALTREALTADVARESLASVVCPVCGRPKQAGNTFCMSCWGNLPGTHQSALNVIAIGHGYEDLMFDAMEHLGAAAFHTEARP